MFKWIARIFLLGILIILLFGVYAYFSLKSTQPPDIKDAPYALQAYYETSSIKFPTRYYYAEEIEINSGRAKLINYWRYDGEKYYKMKEEKLVEPPFDIIRRLK